VVSPLLRRAPVRHVADRLWLSLLLVTFVLVSSAAASAPLVVESAQNAAVRRVLATTATADAAAVRQQPLLRITGGREAPVEGSRARQAMEEVPGLAPARILGVSFGDELTPAGSSWRSLVAPALGGVEPVDRRLAAVDDPAAVLVPAPGSPAGTAAPGGVWLDEAAATDLGVRPGDQVSIS
jgi:hypothetical protein